MEKNNNPKLNSARVNANANLQNSSAPNLARKMPARPGLPPRPGVNQKPKTKRVEPAKEEQKQQTLSNTYKNKPNKKSKVKTDNQKPKQKQAKVKKEKTKESKAKKEKKELTKEELAERKALIKKVSIIAAAVIVLGIGIFFAVTMIITGIKNNQQLVITQGQLVEVASFNNQYILQAPENDEATTYIFEIKQGDNTPIEIYSEENVLDVSTLFSVPSEFQLRYYIQKTSDKSKSMPSAWITYVSQNKLIAPILTYNQESNTLEYNYVENAGSYEFFYSGQAGVSSFIEDYSPNPGDNGRGSVEIELAYGVYDITVVAHPQTGDVFHTASEASNAVIAYNYGQKTAPNGAVYNLSNQTITIDASNLTTLPEEFKIFVGEEEISFYPQTLEEEYVINLASHDITLTIGIEVYIVSVGDGAFVLDSTQVVATAQN